MNIAHDTEAVKPDYDFIFVKPEGTYRWSYQIDGGVKHSLSEEKVYPYIASFLDSPEERHKVIDIMQRHQPFILRCQDRRVAELHPEEDTQDFHKGKINNELSSVLQTYDSRSHSDFSIADRMYKSLYRMGDKS